MARSISLLCRALCGIYAHAPAEAFSPHHLSVITMPRSKTKTTEPRKYTRRGEDQLIADLQAKIERLKERAAAKATQRDPTFRLINKAVKAIDAATAATSDQPL